MIRVDHTGSQATNSFVAKPNFCFIHHIILGEHFVKLIFHVLFMYTAYWSFAVIEGSLQALSINDDETPQHLQSHPTKVNDELPERLSSSPAVVDDNINNALNSSTNLNEKIEATVDSDSKSETADQKLPDQEQNTAKNITKQGQTFDERLVRNVDCAEFTPTKKTLNTSAPEFIPLDDENDSFDEDEEDQSTTASEEAKASVDRPALLRVPSQGKMFKLEILMYLKVSKLSSFQVMVKGIF